ncbi:MAG: hypothetical protein Q9220_001177 [cf. Caloplaca sp. 1 TL-2023]
MGIITDIDGWHQKVFSEAFVHSWKASALRDDNVTQRMLDWCIREVQWYTRDFKESGIVPALDGGIIKADELIPSSILNGVRDAAEDLEEVMRHSSISSIEPSQYLSIVDPYMFAISSGRTRCVRPGLEQGVSGEDLRYQDGTGWFYSPPPDNDIYRPWLTRFSNGPQKHHWLPFETSFDTDNPTMRIASYINDVHPIQHKQFYTALESFIDICIPLFDKSLTIIETPSRFFSPRIDVEDRTNGPLPNREPGAFRSPEERARPEYLGSRKNPHIKQPTVNLRKEFRTAGLQFVLEVASIDLHPEKPSFPSQEWHVQGLPSERICATVLYVYDSSNISEGSISFRQRVSNDEPIWFNAVIPTTADTEFVFGIKDGGYMVLEAGDVAIRSGRVICFPNTFQTRLNEIRLQDPSCAGSCKILTLHLIDPRRRIISTAMVPQQRRDWWAAELRETVDALRVLPPEVFDMIIDAVQDYPISVHDAKIMKQESLAERAEL